MVFSGHMVDADGREPARFPPAHVPRVRSEIRRAIAEVDAAAAVSGAACGADLLCCEEWLATGRPLEVLLPRDTEAFLEESVRFAGPPWEAAFRRVTEHPRVTVVGPDPEMLAAENPHPANARRLVERALRGGGPLQAVIVWDRRAGAAGGTGQLAALLERAGAAVRVIEP